jgi:hypothetical protein
MEYFLYDMNFIVCDVLRNMQDKNLTSRSAYVPFS